MKKLLAIISIAVLAAACVKQPTPEPEPVVEKVYVKFSANLDEDTKATIKNMKWETGDKITIWVKSELDKAIYAGDEVEIKNIETGTFEGMIASPNPEGDTFYAAYKASGIQKVNNTYEPVFNIPASQTTAAAGATKAMLKGQFTGVKEELNFAGDNAMKAATAKLQITVSEGVTNVVFAGMSDETITAGSKTLTYSGAATTDIEFIVPAMTFSNGYKVTYTNARGTMYQSYSGSKSFVDGKERTINCTFVPFSISCAIDADHAPKTSYDYYLAGNITKANSSDFETKGRLSGGTDENPWQYDEDAQGIFTGKIERGKAKMVISGISSSLIPSNLKIKEYGCYVKRVGGQEGKDVYATEQSINLTKDFSWDVLYKKDEAATHMIEVDAGDLEIKPYVIINDGSADTEYKAPTAYTLHVTGLPHQSDHKDLWYVCTQGSGNNQVSGVVRRHPDDTNYPIDMFEQTQTGSWRDYCVRSRKFNIPAETNAQVIMHGTLWAPHSINAYFWFDATNDSFVFHKGVDRTGSNGEKLKNLSDCDAYDEESEARQHTKYLDLGETYSGVTYGHVNDNTITLSPSNPAANVYLWIHRGTTASLFEYVGYWCRYVKVQYAAPTQN